jgi:uncharacterized membrane protein YbaN (DUF454 family)
MNSDKGNAAGIGKANAKNSDGGAHGPADRDAHTPAKAAGRGAGRGIAKRLLKPLFIAVGFISLALGVIGVAVPVLPTTPFLLLTAFCFAQGSERFHRWFVGTTLYKRHLESFVKNRSMALKTKIAICAPVTLMLLAAMYFAPIWHARVAIGAVLLLKYYFFIFRIKTAPDEGKAKKVNAQ